MTVLVITVSIFFLYLVYERILLARLRRSVPLVIAVTGTRGKSTVVRMLASVLRESGRVVLAKTTGSQAQYLLPDGTVEPVHRRGLVSVLEQKDALGKASRLNAGCLVVEIMSIRPENHVVESQRILKPDIVVLTNVRKDHTEAMGATEEDIARVLRIDCTDRAEVYVPKAFEHFLRPGPAMEEVLQVTAVSSTQAAPSVRFGVDLPKNDFSENLDLVAAVSRRLSIEDAVVVRGIQKAAHDIGRFRIWTLELDKKKFFAVNAFAANDPESTMMVYDRTHEILGTTARSYTGLLNLRADRPDRTLQWIDALNSEMGEKFARIHIVGGHATVVRRRVAGSDVLDSGPPELQTRIIAENMEENGVLFGIGNISGAGEELVAFWQREGKEFGI